MVLARLAPRPGFGIRRRAWRSHGPRGQPGSQLAGEMEGREHSKVDAPFRFSSLMPLFIFEEPCE